MSARAISHFTVMTLMLACSDAICQDSSKSILDRITQDPLREADLARVENEPLNVGTLPALRNAFEQHASKADKQLLAITLIHLGEKSEAYYDFLARYVKDAVEDRTPSVFKYDSKGRAVKGEYDPGFENWCALNRQDPKIVARLQWSRAMDVYMLARAQDPRAVDLFIRGLNAPNEFVVLYSVQGLGRLSVESAIPNIARAAERLPSEAAAGIGMQLPWFSSVRAYELMERLVPDARLRQLFQNDGARLKLIELERVQRRSAIQR